MADAKRYDTEPVSLVDWNLNDLIGSLCVPAVADAIEETFKTHPITVDLENYFGLPGWSESPFPEDPLVLAMDVPLSSGDHYLKFAVSLTEVFDEWMEFADVDGNGRQARRVIQVRDRLQELIRRIDETYPRDYLAETAKLPD